MGGCSARPPVKPAAEETFGLEDSWYQDFQRWLADDGHPFYCRMGWQRSDGHQTDMWPSRYRASSDERVMAR